MILNFLIQSYAKHRVKKMTTKFKHYGGGGWIDSSATIVNPENVYLGKKVHINKEVYISALGGVHIEDYVTLSPRCMLFSSGYDTQLIVHGKRKHKDEEIFIGEGSWICGGAIILPGVRITGKHVIVAAGSVVKNSIDEDNVVVAGNPAKIVKRIEK